MDWGLSLGVSPPSHRKDVHFHCAGFSLRSGSTTWAFAELGFCCAWPQPHGGWARLNLSHSTRDVWGVCNFLGSVSRQQKFEAMDRPVLQLSVTAQFYLASKKKNASLRCEGGPTQKKRREARGSILAPLFYVFSPPSELALCKLS